MDFRISLKDFVDRRLSAAELVIELDRLIAAAPERRELLRNQVEECKRDMGLSRAVYEALCMRLHAANAEGIGMNEATVAASRFPGVKNIEKTSHDSTEDTVMERRGALDATVMTPEAESTRIREAIPPPQTISSAPLQEDVDPRLQEQLAPGMVLKDRFVLEEILGVGGMSVVFRARDLRKEEAQDRTPHVAIKVLGPEFKHHPESLKVLQREAKKAQTLAHPNIVNVYDFDRDGHTIFMTMEILAGQGLDKLIKVNRLGGLPLAEVVPIVDGIAQALGYAHEKNIIHSDLKPGNVYITKDNTVKVLDFGIARARRDGEAGAADADNFDAGTLGALTPTYASCEMLEGLEPDPRDDIYALACMTYELLTGRHPFARKSAVEAREANMQAAPIPGLKRRQWTALRNALAFKREERTDDVLRFVNELKPHKLPWRSIAAVSVIIVGSLGGWAYYAYQNKQLAQELGDDLARRAPVTLNAEQQAKINDLLDVGKLYMTLGQYAAPPGDSAFDAYQKVLEIDPRNQEARDGERKIAELYQDKGRTALQQGDLAQAKTMIELGLYVRPADANLLELQKELKSSQGGS